MVDCVFASPDYSNYDGLEFYDVPNTEKFELILNYPVIGLIDNMPHVKKFWTCKKMSLK